MLSRKDNHIMSTPRRSARIAALHAAKNVSKMVAPPASALQHEPSMPSRMADVDMDMQEYEELFENYNLCFKVKESLQAFQKQLRFLQHKRYLLDFFTAEQLKELHQFIQEFHKDHNEWNQKFADEMAAVVRKNKCTYITDDKNFNVYFQGSIMSFLNTKKEIHNLFTATHHDVMTVYHLIKKRV